MEDFLNTLEGEVAYEDYKEFLINLLGDDDSQFVSRFFNLISDPMGALSEESYQEALSNLGFEPAQKGEKQKNIEKFSLLVEKTQTDNPVVIAGQLIKEFNFDIDGEICIYEIPKLLEGYGAMLPIDTVFKVFVDLDTDESMKLGHDELSSFLWDFWSSNPKISNHTELVQKAFEFKLEELSGKDKEPGNITQEEAESTLQNFKILEADKEKFDNFLETHDLGSVSDLDKHVIDDCVFEFINPLTAEHLCKWLTFFKIRREREEEEEDEEDDDDWKEEILDELLDCVRGVYLHIQSFLGAFSKGEDTLDVTGFAKCLRFLQFTYSEEIIAEIFSKLDKDGSNSIDLCELGPAILKAFKESSNDDSIFLLKKVFQEMADSIVSTN